MKTSMLIILIILAIILTGIVIGLIYSALPGHNPGGGNDGGESDDFVCDSDFYNCADFTTQAQAQDVFEFCGGGDNDVHQLDKDGDGVVCENLS